MTADPQENFNVASLPEYEEVLEDKDDGDDSSWRKDALIYMLGKLTRRRWRIFFRKESVPEMMLVRNF